MNRVRDTTWTEEGLHEVRPGVFRIPLPLPSDALRAVNVYAIVDGERVVLIDGGWALAESQELLSRMLDRIGFGLTDIAEFFVTHMHRDHYTQAVAIRNEHGRGRVNLGEGERDNLPRILERSAGTRVINPAADRMTRAGAFALREQLQAFVEALPFEPFYLEPDVWLSDGQLLDLSSRNLRVLATPGHTAGHVVYLDEQANALFAGDHVLPHITPSIGLEPAPTRFPLADYLDSLNLVRRMPDRMLLPAHGPVADSVHARVDELLTHHDDRFAAMLAAVQAGADTALEVANMVRWTRREWRLDELDLPNGGMAVAETLAHLDVLVTRGDLTSNVDEDGVEHFRA